MTLNHLTIQEAAEGLRKKEFSSKELVQSCLDEIQNRDSELHAYLEVYSKDALETAERIDSGANFNFPLSGIPVAVKDNIMIKDRRSTAGSRILENYYASYDATVIEKLKTQGAVILGKTNLDEFAMGSSTENSAFGPTRNPHDPNRVPGGSSGGSAAAVAAHLTIAALGSDTGGSIRQPAALCGVVGLKPTYGRVSRHGLIAMASSLDQIGPLAKNVDDAKIIYEAIRGGDDFDATAVKDTKLETGDRKLELSKIKIGVPKEYFGAGLDPDVEEIIRAAIKKLENAGADIKEIHLPHSEYALATYYIVVPSEVSANLSRFDGIRYGYRAENHKTLFDVYANSRAQGLGTEVKRRVILGTYTLSAGYYDAYYLKAQKVRSLIRRDFEQAFETVDVILGPTSPTPAFCFGERAVDPLQMYLADIYTVAVNLGGLPAISLPAGVVVRDGKNLPVGLQFIGKWFGEESLLSIAKHTESLLNSLP